MYNAEPTQIKGDFMELLFQIEKFIEYLSNAIWGAPLVILIVGGGIFFTFYCRMLPFFYFGHALQILRGKYNCKEDPGQITHFEALASALAGTVGMGNIGGVALAIHLGGPGALFWMWAGALIGMGTKFFTCSLSIMYRGKDDQGEVQGGPMYVVEEGLGKAFKPLALLFSVAGLIGCLGLVNANQLVQCIGDFVYEPLGLFAHNPMLGKVITGSSVCIIVGMVIFGGIQRIAKVATKMVPFMVLVYLFSALLIFFLNLPKIPDFIYSVFSGAFTYQAAFGGTVGATFIMGIKRATFSTEAGIGTESMAHGATKTKEPIREGLVAMLGPFIDTIVVGTITAFVILISGIDVKSSSGVTLAAMAFGSQLGVLGQALLLIAIITFSLTSLFTYSYYGCKCSAYLFGAKSKTAYNWFYIATILFASVVSLQTVINIIDIMFAIMSIPTMVSAFILCPNVMREAHIYFSRIKPPLQKA